MAAKLTVAISQLIRSAFVKPTIVAYNRLETRARTTEFDRALRGEIRDPLWMLARQWQFGEFQGTDAASHTSAKILFEHQQVDRIELNGELLPYNYSDIPLETMVERESFPLTTRPGNEGRSYSDILFGAQMGQYFLRSLLPALQKYKAKYILTYAFNAADDDVEAQQVIGSIGTRTVDGCVLYAAIRDGSHAAMLLTDATFLPADAEALTILATDFVSHFSAVSGRVFHEPLDKATTAWASRQLEYQFKVAVPVSGEPQLEFPADKYPGGHLDWYNFNMGIAGQRSKFAGEAALAADNEDIASFIPTPVHFKGMPGTRFWQIDDAGLDLGQIDTSLTGTMYLMLAEFGMTYSNDWFVLPHVMQANSVCEIKGIMVRNVFGEHTVIRPAGKSADTSWHKWMMFAQTPEQAMPGTGSLFYMVPTVGKIMESAPIEQINDIRDEMAQMAWAIEDIVPSQMGRGMPVKQVPAQSVPPVNASGAAGIRYSLGNVAPANWVPFIPVHIDGSSSEIRLQRARMITGTAAKGVLINETPAPYFINEEEITRSGVIITRSYKRCRWYNGKTLLWIGRKKDTGRGEGSSAIKYDQVSDVS